MDEKLLENSESNNQTQNNKYFYNDYVKYIANAFIGILGTSYFIVMIMIYDDIHHMSTNFDDILKIFNFNNTSIEETSQQLELIKKCVLQKYCKRV